jgi:hypothetical protein
MTRAKWTRGVAQAVKCKSKALSSNPKPAKKKKKTAKRVVAPLPMSGGLTGGDIVFAVIRPQA